MEIGKAFTFVNEDDDWLKKLAIGAALILIGNLLLGWLIIPMLLTLFVVGYVIAIIRSVINNEERPLPEWNDWGQLFIDGVIVTVAILVYSLPAILLGVCGAVAALGTLDSSGELTGGGIAGISLFSCLVILYAIVLAFLIPAILIQYARTGEFGSLFQFGEIMAITRQNLVDILLVIVVYLVASIVLSLVGSISAITVCGPLIIFPAGSAWIYYATGHMCGQIGRKMNDKNLEAAYDAA
ncbi:MAG: DUF4013 domain-containing protein [Chloroflexota bacterium]|nr:MAG: DUF4013 domain-containing protein [Chloroflexota bacterium]